MVPMSVINPRTKIVNFRLSEDEFERLRSACQTTCARSVSEYARTAVLRCLDEQVLTSQLTSGSNSLVDQKIANLETRIDDLVRLFAATSSDLTGLGAALPMTCEPVELQVSS